MDKAKIRGIGWILLDTRTDGFYYRSEKVIDCSGEILSDKVLAYLIID
jgi:hypothetical protein